jgi:hypothetical protein
VETLSDAIDRLRARGYELDLYAAADGRLRCGTCNREFEPATFSIEETVRFEGESDPEDEAILFAIAGPEDHRGLYSAPYGTAATPEDMEVTQALSPRR